MNDRPGKRWLLGVILLYALHGVWLVMNVRTLKEAIAELAPAEWAPGARFNLVSLLRMLVDQAPTCILALAGIGLALWCGRGALRIVLVILGLALWAAYAWMPVFLMP